MSNTPEPFVIKVFVDLYNCFTGCLSSNYDAVGSIIIAGFGGLADYLLDDNHKLSAMFANLFLAGFAGYIIFLLCNVYEFSAPWTSICCGIGGMSSKSFLQIIRKIFINKVKKYGE